MGTVSKRPAWSYSVIKMFEDCPKKYYHLKVAKDYSDPPTPELHYGNEFHKAAEEYVSGRVNKLDPRFSFAKGLLDRIKLMSGEKKCELKLNLDQELKPCGTFDKGVWLRGVADLVILSEDGKTAKVVDYKTGKNANYADTDQLDLMALGIFRYFPEVQYVRAGLLFVIPKRLVESEYRREDTPDMWKDWVARYNKLREAFAKDVWNAKPSGLCKKHCPVLECPHNGRG